MPRRFVYLLLTGITVFAAYLRWTELGVPSLWLDEILHLQVTGNLDWSNPWRLVTGLREARGYAENGALYYALQRLGQVLAPGDLGVRLLPALVGTLTVPLFALVAGQFTTHRDRHLVELVAGCAFAVSPLHVYYSREGRPYYLLMALAVLLLWLLLLATRPQTLSRRTLLSIGVCCVASAYIGLHALPVLGAAATLCALILLSTPLLRRSVQSELPVHVRRNLLGLAAGLTAAIAMCGVLYLSRTQHNVPTLELGEAQQKLVEAPVFEALISEATLLRFAASMTTAGRTSLHFGERGWMLVFLACCGIASFLLRRPEADQAAGPQQPTAVDRALIAVGMFALPAANSIAALGSTGRWFHVRYTSAAQPAFLLLVALGTAAVASILARFATRLVPQLPRAPAEAVLVVGTTFVVIFPNIGPARSDPYQRVDWGSIAEFVDQTVLPGEPVVIATEWPRVCLDHYLKQRGRELDYIKIWQDSDLGRAAVADHPRGWMMSAGVRTSNDARDWMHSFVPVLQDHKEEFRLFYFPDLPDLFDTRQDTEQGAYFQSLFAEGGRRFDFNGPRVLQGIGWSFAERNGAQGYQWALGREARLGVPIATPKDLEIEFAARPLDQATKPQVLDFWLGDQFVKRVALEPGWNRLRFLVPRDVWSEQTHVLRIFFSTTDRPVDVIEGATDSRELAVAFDWLRVLEPGTG